MNRLAAFASIVFGYLFMALAVMVAVETFGRKLFDFSLQGVDELGGYVLAVASSLAFTVALVDRAHIRIDLLHPKLPAALRSLLNWLSIVLMAGLAVLLAWVGWLLLRETIEYGSTAPTPWATPLVYPQGLAWLGLVLFAVIALAMALRASGLIVRGDRAALDRDFGPKGADDELEAELQDLKRR